MIYLYAVTEPGAPAPDEPGLDDQPLEVLEAGEVAALISRHDRTGFEPDPEALWHHDRVVERAMSHGAVLPARFASTFVDTDAVTEALRGDETALRQALDAVRGCVELAVRVSLPASDCPAPRDGRDYVARKLLRHRESRFAEQALEPLAAHAVRSHRRAASGDASTLTASYLVRADEVPRFAEQVRRLVQAHDELSVSCTGPWPPYSFVAPESP